MRMPRGSGFTFFSKVRKKRLSFFLFFIVVNCQLSVVNCYSQDRRPDRPLLPFQQNASQQGNDEQLAIQFYQDHEYDKAAEIYERLFQQKPGSYYYQYLLFCWVEIKEYNKAEKLIKKQQKAEPTALRFMVDMGYLKYREGNEEKSKKIYEDAISKLTPNQQQIADLANAFSARGEYEYAIKTYLRGRDLLKNSYPFNVEMAGIYERMGDFTSVIEQYLDLLEINRSYMNTVQDRLQMLLSNDINNEKNDRFRKVLLARAQQYPDKIWYAELLWWYSIQQKDFDLAFIQGKALDKRLQESGDRLVQLAGLAASNEEYKLAMECYQYLIAKGTDFPFYDLSRRELINTRYLMALSAPSPSKQLLTGLEKEMKEEIGKSQEDPESISLTRNLAHLEAFYLKKTDEAAALLENAIEIPGITPQQRAECKIELADILLFTDDVWEATLLYQQVYKEFKNDIIGQEAKFKNTMLSFYIGEFKWALAQADILKASTSRFIANDAIALSLLISEDLDPDSNTVALGYYARADLLDYRNEEDLALKTLDSIPQLFTEHPILQQVIFKKAMIMQKQGQFIKADSLFGQLVMVYPDGILADEALMYRASLTEKKLNNKEQAMALYQELMEKYPGSIFVPDARKRFRTLRGDRM